MAVKVGEKALVTSDKIAPYRIGDPLDNVTFNKQVKLDEQITTYVNVQLGRVDMQIGPDHASLSCWLNNCECWISYTSQDGITYDGEDFYYRDAYGNEITAWDVPVSLGEVSMEYTSNPEYLSKFITAEQTDFKGIFTAVDGINYRKAIDVTGKTVTLPIDLSTYNNAASRLSSGLYVLLYRKSENVLYLIADYYIHKTTDNKVYMLRWANTSSNPTVYKYDLNNSIPIEETITWEVPQSGYLVNSLADDYVFIHNVRLYPSLTWCSGQSATSYNVNPFVQGLCWKNTNIGCSTPSNVVLPGYKVMTNKGIVTGELGSKIESSNDLLLINDVLKGLRTFKLTSLGNFFRKKDAEYLPIFKVLDTSSVTDYNGAFRGFNKLKEFDLADLNFSGLTTSYYQAMDKLFYECSSMVSLYNIDKLNDLNASNLFTRDGYYLFFELLQGCSSLKEITGLNKLTGARCSGYVGFMKDCSNMEIIDLSSLVSDNVSGTNIYSDMFMGCSKARQILLPKFNFANCKNSTHTSYARLFSGCSSLELLDLRSSSFNSLPTTNDMFKDVPQDCLIICKDTTAKNFILSARSDLTNVKTVAEYEG